MLIEHETFGPETGSPRDRARGWTPCFAAVIRSAGIEGQVIGGALLGCELRVTRRLRATRRLTSGHDTSLLERLS
jgi:hypothetical protein